MAAFSLRQPDKLMKQVKRLAKRENVSTNHMIGQLLKQALAETEKKES